MTTIKYSTGKLICGMVLSCPITLLGLELAMYGHRKIFFAGLIFLIVGPLMLLGTLKLLMGDQIALRYDNRSLEIGTMWRKGKFAWPQVNFIGTQVTTTRGFFGLVRTGQSEMLVVKVDGGMLGSTTYSISKLLLDLGHIAYADLPHLLSEARDGTHVAMGHDEAMRPAQPPQRYGAPSTAEPTLNGQRLDSGALAMPAQRPAVSGFGRKGL
jgi:hypothetical protein